MEEVRHVHAARLLQKALLRICRARLVAAWDVWQAAAFAHKRTAEARAAALRRMERALRRMELAACSRAWVVWWP